MLASINHKANIIVADDDKSVRTVIAHALIRQGYQVKTASSIAGLWDIAILGHGEVLITDVSFPDGDALALLPRLQTRRSDLNIIVMSARRNLLTAIKTKQSNVFNYLPKPFELKQLLDIVHAACAEGDKQANKQRIEINLPKHISPALIGKSATMQAIFERLTKLSSQSTPLLIFSESGLGKLSIAQTIHEIGIAADKVFRSVNLAEIDESQQSEILFGLEGLFTRTPSGTIFINHIDYLSDKVQKQLIQFIETNGHLGISAHNSAELRIITGTTNNLKQCVENGQFREDLFRYFSEAILHLPPLRERLEDIPQLVAHFCKNMNITLNKNITLDRQAIGVLQAHNWTGNINELETVINQLYTTSKTQITASMITSQISQIAQNLTNTQNLTNNNHNLGQLMQMRIEGYFKDSGSEIPDAGLYGRILAEIERPLIIATMHHTSGNQIKAAHILGLNRNTLRKKIKELNISTRRTDYKNQTK